MTHSNWHLKDTQSGRRYGNSAESQKLKIARDSWILEGNTITQRSWSATSRTSSTNEQGYTQSDMEELNRIANGKITSHLLQNGLTRDTNTRSCNTTMQEAAKPCRPKNTLNTNKVYSGKEKTWSDNSQNPILNSGNRGLHGHSHFQGLRGANLRHHKHGDNNNQPHLNPSNSSGTQERRQAQGDLLLRNKSDSSELYLFFFELTGGAHSEAREAHFAHFSFFTVQGRIEKSFHRVIRR